MSSLQEFSFPLTIELHTPILSLPFISQSSSSSNSPILKKIPQSKEDLMPLWFKELNEKIEKNLEKLDGISSDNDSPILKKILHKKEDLLPNWFKEINKTYDKFCEDLQRVQTNQKELTENLKKFDERKLLIEKRHQELEKMQKINNFKAIEDLKNTKTGLFLLNYHIILLIITMAVDKETGYLRSLLRMTRVNRYFNRLLDSEYIWRFVVQDYLGLNFVMINEENHKNEESHKNEKKDVFLTNKKNEDFWKNSMRFLWVKFRFFKKQMIYYRECGCPLKIQLKSLQKDLLNSMKFISAMSTLFMNTSKISENNEYDEFPQLFRFYFEFFTQEKIFFFLSILTQSTDYFLRFYAIDSLISSMNLINVFREKINQQINLSKLFEKHEKNSTNHEQMLLFYVNMKIIEENLVILAETIHFNKCFSLNNYKEDQCLFQGILEKKTQCFGCVYEFYHGKIENFNCLFFIDNEGNSQIDLIFLKNPLLNFTIFGSFSIKNMNNYQGNTNEITRSLSFGKLFYKNLELKAYINIVYQRKNQKFIKGLCLYASNQEHEAILYIKIL